jgi:V8-like Glu-specific endopeptidase
VTMPVRTLIASLVAALVLVSTAAAITGGRVDGNAHPYVGALVVDGAVTCSGVLLAPTVFATAGHCTAGLAPGARIQVSFDSSLDPSRWSLLGGTAHTDPDYKGVGSDSHDLAVVTLDVANAIAPARLPALGAAGATSSVTSVGYGYSTYSAQGGFGYDGLRHAAESPVVGLAKALLKVSTRDAGPCLGDSGGPMLAGDTVLALTSGGAKDCSGKAEGYRLDTAAARTFLGGFVRLP